MASGFANGSIGWLLLLGASCAEQSVALSPQAQAVQVATTEPPSNARNLGPIEAKDSEDCDLVSDKGTRDRALAALKEAAARRGMDFVKVVSEREPFSGHDCYHKAYVLKGIGYRVQPAAPTPTPSAPSAAPLTSVPASLPAPGPSCDPPCAVGFVCQAGVCAAACEPACIAPQICRADRVCVTPAQ